MLGIEYPDLKGGVTGKALIDAMQASPQGAIEFEFGRAPMPVRDVSLWPNG